MDGLCFLFFLVLAFIHILAPLVGGYLCIYIGRANAVVDFIGRKTGSQHSDGSPRLRNSNLADLSKRGAC